MADDIFNTVKAGDVKGLVGIVKKDGKQSILDARDAEGNSPLHVAVLNKQKTMVQALLKLKHDLNVQNTEGDTALHLAVGNKITDIAALLIKEGANAGIQNKAGVDATTLLKESKAEKEAPAEAAEGEAAAPADEGPTEEEKLAQEADKKRLEEEKKAAEAAAAEAKKAQKEEAEKKAAEDALLPVENPDGGPPLAAACKEAPSGAAKNLKTKALRDISFRGGLSPPKESTAAKRILTITQPACYTKKVAVPVDYTVKDLLDMYADKIDLKLVQPFTLVELVLAEGEDHHISLATQCTERNLDLDKTIEEQDINENAIVMIKPAFYKTLDNMEEQDPVAVSIYLQMVRRDLVTGHFECYEMVAVALAALFVQYDLGNYNANVHKVGYFSDTLHTMLPKNIVAINSSNRLQKRLLRAYAKLKGVSKMDAALKCIQLVRTLPTYGTSFYPCMLGSDEGELGVAEDGVMLRLKGDSWILYPFNQMSALYKLSNGIQVHAENAQEKMVVEFSPREEDLDYVMETLRAYYALLLLSAAPNDWCHLSSIDMPKSELPPGSLFALPVTRMFDQPYYSRAAQFKAEYVKHCSKKAGLSHLEDMLEALEEAEDSGTNYGYLNLRGFDTQIEQLEMISKALRDSHSYQPLFPEQFRENMNITRIDLQNCNLGKNREAFSKVCQFLQTGFSGIEVSIEHFDISNNQLKEDMFMPLSSSLKVLSPLSYINISGNSLNEQGVVGFISGISEEHGHAPKELICVGCGMNERGTHLLANRLYQSNTLERVDLSANKMGDTGASEVLETLKNSRSIVEINVSDNPFGSKANKELVARLEDTIRCRSWFLNNCKVKAPCVEPFAANIKKNIIWNLELSGNALGSKACNALLEALTETSSLSRLRLDGNKLDKNFGLALADALRTNRSLEYCSVSHNQLGNAGAIALCESLNSNKVLKVLMLQDNKIDGKACQAMEAALRNSGTIEEVDLSGNKLGDEGVKAFAEGLAKDRMYLQRLRMQDVKMTDVGALELSIQLVSNTRLRELYIGTNKITAEGATALFKTFITNQNIEEVEVCGVDRSALPVIQRAMTNENLKAHITHDEE